MSTVFVTLCDQSYFPKAKRTIDELRSLGKWTGDVVLVAVDFEPPSLKDVILYKTSHIPTEALLEFYKEHPITKGDGRHITRLYQWDKLQVFSYFFRKWKRVIFLDAGMRVFHDVAQFLTIDCTGAFLSPDDCDYPYNPTLEFRKCIDDVACPNTYASLLEKFSPSILSRHFFVSALFMYDTGLLETISYGELLDAMYRYPIGTCNDMWILNLIFNCKYNVWKPFPKKIDNVYVFGYNESPNNGTPGSWRDFYFIKYPLYAPESVVVDPSTVFITLCDESYYPKARRTITELKTNGLWYGDVVLMAIDFEPEPIPGVQIHRTQHMDVDKLLAQWKEHPIRPMDDNRHFGKIYQWDKLQVFKPFFRSWDRVVFLDAGLRVFDSVAPLLALNWKGKFLAPDDSDPYDNGARFRIQLDLEANPEITQLLLTEYSESILDGHYFLNCMFMFDTSLLEMVTFEEMETAMNKYPICMCNEMGIMNLFFTFKLGVWQPFPQCVNNKYLFGWCESNYREQPDWSSFHFMKYPRSAPLITPSNHYCL